MRAIKIDAVNRTVTEIEVPDGDGVLHALHDNICCRTITAVTIHRWQDGRRETLYVDDEGLLKEPRDHFFRLRRGAPVLAGSGVILGTDEAGHNVHTLLPLDLIEQSVQFLTRVEAGDPQPYMSITSFK